MFNYKEIWIAILITTISIPLVCQVIGVNLDVESFENRQLVKFPQYPRDIKELKQWTVNFEKYINDNLPFRILMMKTYNTLLHQLKISPNKNLIIGKNGWLFNNFNNALNQHLTRSTLTQEEVKGKCKVIKKNAAYFKSKNIPFYFFIAPNKHTIYNEYLPQYAISYTGKKRNFDLVIRTLNKDVNVVNIRPNLLEHKQKLPKLYYKTDSHWNGFGSFVAYKKIMENIQNEFPNLNTISWKDMHRKKETKNRTDLSKILGLWYKLESSEFNLKLKINNRASIKRIGKEKRIFAKETHVIETKNSSGPVLLILRDSFSTALIPYYEHSFSKIIATHHNHGNWDTSLVEKYNPDIVIFGMVERFLGEDFIDTKF